MQTVFIMKKNWLKTIINLMLSLSFIFGLVYAAFLSQTESVWLGKTLFFLVSEPSCVEAGVYDAQLQGGAGYHFHYNQRDYIVYSVFVSAEEGQSACLSLSSSVERVSLLKIIIPYLYFQTYNEKKNITGYTSAIRILYNYIEILNLEIKRLSDGATQQSAKQTLSLLINQLRYTSQIYEENYLIFSQICDDVARTLQSLLKDIVYTKDLRYLLCNLSVNFLQLTSSFSI